MSLVIFGTSGGMRPHHRSLTSTTPLGTWIKRYRRTEGTGVFWYRTGSVHGLNGIGEPKVRACFGIGAGGTWINSDTKTSTIACLLVNTREFLGGFLENSGNFRLGPVTKIDILE